MYSHWLNLRLIYLNIENVPDITTHYTMHFTNWEIFMSMFGVNMRLSDLANLDCKDSLDTDKL